MNNERLQYLLGKYQQEACSEEEYAELDDWFHSLNYPNIDFKQWMAEAGGSDQTAVLMLEEFKSKYLPMAEAEEDQSSKPMLIKVKLWKRISIAAAAVAAITLSVWLYNSSSRQSAATRDLSTFTNDIAPGKNTATLTLPNGKTITLSDAKTGVVIDASKLTYSDGTDLGDRHPEFISGSRTREAVMLTASTPRGGTYEVILPDSTHVWLNAASSLKFPSAFTGKERIVELTGEAYFEVAAAYVSTTTSPSSPSTSPPSPATSPSLRERRTKQSFIVRSAGQEVAVLGTHFNINSYEATVITTLVEGSVQVTPLHQPSKKAIIKPGQQAVVSKNLLEILPVDVEVATAWKNGNFLFRNERLESIMKRVAYWYDVEVIYLYDKRDLKYTGVIGRKRNLSSILTLLEAAGNVKFKIEGRKVYVFD